MKAGVKGRIEAARRLVRIEEEGAYAGLVGDRSLGGEAERVATSLVAGVTRWKRWLDYLAATCYRGDYENLEPALRQVLRIGAFDLAVAGTAPHAAVHQAVEAARREIRPGAGKLANAVLRALDRKKPWEGALTGDSVSALSVRWSHPDWLVERWVARFGVEDTRRLLAHNNAPPVYSIRVSERRDAFLSFLDAEHVPWSRSPWLDDFVRVERLQPVVRGGWLREGAVAVQDESAGLVVRMLDPQPGETVVDACAAPGGKSRYAAERMGGDGRVVAIDVSEKRLGLLKRTPTQTPVETVAADFREWASAHRGAADRVLVDAPCTGLGVLAGRADLRWKRTPQDFDDLIPLQASILDAAADVVRRGGVLVYSTCSIAPEENHGQARDFLARHPEFRLEAPEGLPAAVVDAEGFLATLPHRDGIDGAFGARFRRLG